MRQHGRKAIEKVGRTQPAALLKIIALTLPKEHKVEHSRSVSELSDQQLNAMIEALSARLEARAAGIDVPPLIDVTPDGEVIALPVPDVQVTVVGGRQWTGAKSLICLGVLRSTVK
jgi:hypothetical protein